MPPRKIQWCQRGVKLLIELYKEHPNLYDPKHENYHNRLSRTDSINQILLEMQNIYEDINTSDLKTKIGTLRSQYQAHIKKEGIGTEDKVAPYWMNDFDFLQPFFKCKDQKAVNSSKTKKESVADYNYFEQQLGDEENSNTTLPSVNTEVIEGSSMDRLLDTARVTLLKVATNKRKYKPVVETFGEYVKSELDRIDDPDKRRRMRHKIMKVIMAEVEQS